MTPRHVVIVGAARSGTKILRDALSATTGAGTVPYDVNYVWRYGNEDAPHDNLSPECLNERRLRFIRRFVDRYAAGAPPAVIEKTVGNALRVPFVISVLPDAYFVHLVRNGLDVIESSLRQWTSPTDWGYLGRKACHFPPRLAPRYGSRYLASLAAQRLRSDHRARSWGPRYPGIDADLQTEGLLVACARQWRESVEAAQRAFEEARAPVVEIRYEELVRDPAVHLSKLADFVGLPAGPDAVRSAARAITADRLGVSPSSFVGEQREVLEAEIGATLERLGYERPSPPRDRLPHGEMKRAW